MNLGQLKTRVKRQFGDESAVQIQDDDIVSWANQACIDVVRASDDLLQAVQTTDLIEGQTVYTPPTDMLSLRNVTLKTAVDQSYFTLKAYNIQDFNEYVDGWDGNYYAPGNPYIFMFYNGAINIFPKPNSSQESGIKIYYNRYPGTLAVDSDEIPLPLVYHNAILEFCLQQAYELDENWEGSGNKSAQFTSSINSIRELQEWQTQDEYPTIKVRAEDAW